MNTQTISQFELLDTELLATVEGGGCTQQGAGKAVIKGMITGVIGGIPGGPLTMAVGYNFGAVGGAAAYLATCWW
ncbi:Blp family class II bacteriocin [Streptococcus acidominimus]|uniref:Pore-forming peptide bacteriocin n=1 Tax=Streptococcus acidominimus TaxID=1326 RepID=A0A1Q8E7J6_STRAI|nr:Blp family class II bacteriocin [Streptococcus acidominimus]OLF47789.1 hypothetical protein BU200_09990 [Streptococcus acidominimus]SUN08032.1 pore-forming peptide bacteriocin [Streptococcus acidominimus]